MSSAVPLARARAPKASTGPSGSYTHTHTHTRIRSHSSRNWTLLSAVVLLATAMYLLHSYMPLRSGRVQRFTLLPSQDGRNGDERALPHTHTHTHTRTRTRKLKLRKGYTHPLEHAATRGAAGTKVHGPGGDEETGGRRLPPGVRVGLAEGLGVAERARKGVGRGFRRVVGAEEGGEGGPVVAECAQGEPDCFVVYEDDPRFKCATEGKCEEQAAVAQAPPEDEHNMPPPAQPAPPEEQPQEPPAPDQQPPAPEPMEPRAPPQDVPGPQQEPPSPQNVIVDPPAVANGPPRPPRDPTWAPEQRPIPGEKDVTSHVFEELTVHSMNPPKPASSYADGISAELNSRLVLAVAMGVHSGNLPVGKKGLIVLPIFATMMPTFLAVAQTNFVYRFYFAYDHNDPVYEHDMWRERVLEEFNKYVREEDARRWHPPGYVPGQTIDSSSIIATLHWVHCNYQGKPAWAHSDAVMAAYKEGADYAYRPNDDTKFPRAPDWADRFIMDLRGRKPIPNLGVVGPYCDAGANSILTHDFTHKTHAAVFGYHYPRSLPNWSSDDWITFVYKFAGMMVKRHDIPVEHVLVGPRYAPDDRGLRLPALNAAIEEGGKTLLRWASDRHGVTVPWVPESITCC